MELRDKVALITGAGSGLGLSTARAFAREVAKIVVNDLREDAARAATADLGPGHSAVGGDVSKETDVAAIVSAAAGRFGRIGILVNNAGVPDSFVPTVEQPLSHWQRLIDIHLTGTYPVSKTVAPHMIRQGGGAILNLNSIAGVIGLPVRTAYSAEGRDRDADPGPPLRMGASQYPRQRPGSAAPARRCRSRRRPEPPGGRPPRPPACPGRA
jgi:NAD(P)-dependent dehydrogenase (short-subunit alcohol dehydrogenase family)